MKTLMKCLVPAFAMAVVLAGVPAFADAVECTDSPQIVVLPDCTTVQLTTCYCHVPDNAPDPDANASDDLTIEIVDLNTLATPTVEIPIVACDGTVLTSCPAPNGDLATGLVIDDVVKRRGKKDGLNTNPKPKLSSTIDCTDCPSDPADSGDKDMETVSVDPDLANNRKNHHYDIVLVDGSTEICTVGFNVHTKSCPEAHE